MPFYERQPFIQPLYQVVTEVMRGDIRVPRFQRPGTSTTWTAEQRGDLLDSLYRGYPIGTVLLWSTAQPIHTLDVVAGVVIPGLSSSSSNPLRLLLDGHQRLSTLIKILGPGLIEDAPASAFQKEIDDEFWVFELDSTFKSDSRERFVLLKPGQQPSKTQIPLNIALNRFKLNQWVRDFDEITNAQMKEVDDLRDRLREYSIPVAVLVAESLDEATVSFKRINSSGTPMSDFNMVAALAYQDDFDPQTLFEKERAEFLAPIGWEAIDDSDILRICAGLVGHNPARMEVDSLAKSLRQNQGIVRQAFMAVEKTAAILKNCGVHGPEALPYSWQLITISILVGKLGVDLSDSRAINGIVRWFWLTTYGEVFAGGTKTSIFSRTSTALSEMIEGGVPDAMDRDVTKKVREVERFDFRAARSKACALTMARLQDNDDTNGQSHLAMANGVGSVQLLVVKGGQRSTWWHLAVIGKDEKVAEVREALRRREQGIFDLYETDVLQKIGIPDKQSGSVMELLQARRKVLIEKEREFVQKLGLEWVD
ncbi:DUF262 domain-containing protein [Massilia varians]|uniref:DUF262 domain-containing protein n=1 Tax=Massilia varians TaxID=457921 RepID=UPI0025539574|nr:DUF262 domain-containing protein [Massilia varians]MDK6079984.1 DUF262 domain-containing protein [Massilia varians]